MDEQQNHSCNHAAKSTLKSVAMLVLAFSSVAYVYQYGRSVNRLGDRSFSVTGEGKVTAIPDIATFSASVITEEGKSLSEAQKLNIDKMNRVIEFLKGLGVNAKDIKTDQYSVYPRYDQYTCEGVSVCPPPRIAGYGVRQSVSVKVRDTEKLSDLLGGVTENGANSVSGVSFVVDDVEKLKNEAREEAIAAAKKQAQMVAKASGFRLGELVSIYEDPSGRGGEPIAYDTMRSSVASGKEDASIPPTIEPGSVEQQVNMVLTYEIR